MGHGREGKTWRRNDLLVIVGPPLYFGPSPYLRILADLSCTSVKAILAPPETGCEAALR